MPISASKTKSPPKRAFWHSQSNTLRKPERHLAQALAVEREHRVRNRRREQRHARLADSARLLGALYDMHLDLRRLGHPQQLVLVEVRFLHAPVLQRDVAVQKRGQAEHDVALDLLLDDVRI